MFKIPLKYEYKHGSEYTEQDIKDDLTSLEELHDLPLSWLAILLILCVALFVALFFIF